MDGLNNFVLVVWVFEISLRCIGYVGSSVGRQPLCRSLIDGSHVSDVLVHVGLKPWVGRVMG
jgi:hypothetical protein